jgi:hypothetical protein
MIENNCYCFYTPRELRFTGNQTLQRKCSGNELIRISYNKYISIMMDTKPEYQRFTLNLMSFYLSCEYEGDFDVSDKQFIPQDWYHKLESIATNQLQPITNCLGTMMKIKRLFPKSQIYGGIIDFGYHGVVGYIYNDMIFMRGILYTNDFRCIAGM